MATELQIKQLEGHLREYRRKYLQKQFADLDESATRIMVNHFLSNVLGYKELEDIITEYEVKGAYADYVIHLKKKQWFVVEVKAIGIDLNAKHLRQSVIYAANEGIDWAILMNGRQIELHRILFTKPLNTVKLFSLDLDDLKNIHTAAKELIFLTKHSVQKGELETFWKRRSALSTESLAKALYCEEVAKIIRRDLKRETKISFDIEDILVALQMVILDKNDVALKVKHKNHANQQSKKTLV